MITYVIICFHRYLHIWAWLIMDYVAEKQDGHWTCTLITDMYFMGKLRKNCHLTLCFIPRPIFSVLTYFFGETKWTKDEGR